MTVQTRVAVAVGLTAWLGAAAHIQAQQKKQEPKLETVRVTNGELKSIRGGALLVIEGTKGYIVKPGPKAKIDITGKADTSVLQRGMFVRFEAKLDKRGNATEEITAVEVFTYNPEVARTGTEKRGDDGTFLVAARLTSFSKNGKFTAQADKKTTVKGTISTEATVDLGVRGASWLRLAKPGDKVTFIGKGRNPTERAPGQVLADEVQVTISAREAGEKKNAEKKTEKKTVEKKKVEKKKVEKKKVEKKE